MLFWPGGSRLNSGKYCDLAKDSYPVPSAQDRVDLWVIPNRVKDLLAEDFGRDGLLINCLDPMLAHRFAECFADVSGLDENRHGRTDFTD